MTLFATPPTGQGRRPRSRSIAGRFLRLGVAPVLIVLPLLASTSNAAIPVIEDPGIVNPAVIELITDTDVAIQIVASDNPTSYSAIGLPAGLSLDSSTGLIEGDFDDPISAAVTLSATNSEGTGNYMATIEVLKREEALPAPTTSSNEQIERGLDVDGTDMAPFTQSPSNAEFTYFFRQTGLGEGGDSLRNRLNLPDNIVCGLRTYVRGPAQVTFSWACDIEFNFDYFSFYVDQDPVPSPNPGELLEEAGHGDVFITGVNALHDYSTMLGPGLHRLEWIYSRDYNDAAGGDEHCRLDNLRITGYPEWAEDENLSVFESDFAIDKEQDGNNLLTEYALGLDPTVDEHAQPLLTFEPDGRAILEIARNDQAIGVNVNIEKMNLSPPGTFPPILETLVDTPSLLRKRESSPQPKGLYRVNVTTP